MAEHGGDATALNGARFKCCPLGALSGGERVDSNSSAATLQKLSVPFVLDRRNRTPIGDQEITEDIQTGTYTDINVHIMLERVITIIIAIPISTTSDYLSKLLLAFCYFISEGEGQRIQPKPEIWGGHPLWEIPGWQSKNYASNRNKNMLFVCSK